MIKPNFSKMKQTAEAQSLSINSPQSSPATAQIDKDWESYLEIEENELRKKKHEKRYKPGGHRKT